MLNRDVLSERPEDTLAAIQWAREQKELREKSNAITTRMNRRMAPILAANYQKAMAENRTVTKKKAISAQQNKNK